MEMDGYSKHCALVQDAPKSAVTIYSREAARSCIDRKGERR